MFFKKKTQAKSQKEISPKTPTKEKPKPLSEEFLDDRLYQFSRKIKKLSKDEASAILLARHLSRLVKADSF